MQVYVKQYMPYDVYGEHFDGEIIGVCTKEKMVEDLKQYLKDARQYFYNEYQNAKKNYNRTIKQRTQAKEKLKTNITKEERRILSSDINIYTFAIKNFAKSCKRYKKLLRNDLEMCEAFAEHCHIEYIPMELEE